MIELILGFLIAVNLYLFVSLRNERKARHNQVQRLERFFFDRVEAEKKRVAEHHLNLKNHFNNIWSQINRLKKTPEANDEQQ